MARPIEFFPKHPVALLQQGEGKEYGALSGLPLRNYPYTNFAMKLKDGTFNQYISLGFMARELELYQGMIEEVLAADAQSGKFFDATKGHYVVNSKADGTLSTYGKFAFERRSDAEIFVAQYGGDIRNYRFTQYMATYDNKEDIKKIEATKKERDYPLGHGIFDSLCPKNFDAKQFTTLRSLKAYLKESKLCGHLHETHLHALSLYLREAKDKPVLQKTKRNPLLVPAKAKCPVCGMFVAKYPRWAAEIDLGNGHKLYFDGVKDMMKFYLSPLKYAKFTQGKTPENIYVTDYYTLDQLDAKKAFYVIGSLVYGPMGHELIPFSKEQDAKQFMRDHAGLNLLGFQELNAEIVFGLDK